MSIPPAIQQTKHLGNVQAGRLVVDELIVGNSSGSSVLGKPTGSGAWQTYTPTIANGTKATSGVTTDIASYQIQGKTLKLQYTYNAGTTGAANGAGTYLISLPPGVTAKVRAAGVQIVGTAYIQSGSTHHAGVVHLFGTSQVFLRVGEAVATQQPWASGFLGFAAAALAVSFMAEIEIE